MLACKTVAIATEIWKGWTNDWPTHEFICTREEEAMQTEWGYEDQPSEEEIADSPKSILDNKLHSIQNSQDIFQFQKIHLKVKDKPHLWYSQDWWYANMPGGGWSAKIKNKDKWWTSRYKGGRGQNYIDICFLRGAVFFFKNAKAFRTNSIWNKYQRWV